MSPTASPPSIWRWRPEPGPWRWPMPGPGWAARRGPAGHHDPGPIMPGVSAGGGLAAGVHRDRGVRRQCGVRGFRARPGHGERADPGAHGRPGAGDRRRRVHHPGGSRRPAHRLDLRRRRRGAGAARRDPDEPGALRAFDLGSDGSQVAAVEVPGGGARDRLGMPVANQRAYSGDGRARGVPAGCAGDDASSLRVLDKAEWDAASVRRFVPHQANIRIIHGVAERLGIGAERVVANIQDVGNTVAASIPLALADAHDAGGWPPGSGC